MDLFKRHPVFGGILAVLAVVVLVELGLIWHSRGAALRAREAEEAARRAVAGLQSLRPYPSREQALAIDADLARTQAVLDGMRAALAGDPAAAAGLARPPPATRTDAFFDLAQFVESARERAAGAGVLVKPDERFGFAAYANEGPEPDFLAPVFRQRLILDYLLGALFNAAPRELVQVQRERAVGPAREGGQPTTTEGGPDTSFFTVDPRVSARVPGFVDSMGFRLVFTGQTGSLRSFLNELALFRLPLVVRSVEVEPVTEGQRGAAPPPATPLASLFGTPAPAPTAAGSSPAGGPVPIVGQNLSRFTVTIEFIELARATPAS